MDDLDDLFDEEIDKVLDKRKYRILTAETIAILEEKVNMALKEGWALLGAPFDSTAGFSQAIMRTPKEKIARMSLA